MATRKPKSQPIQLLDAPIENIHTESQRWTEEVLFAKDECAFLIILIQNTHNAPLLHSKPAKKIEKQLLDFSVHKLDDLLDEIQEHEKFLDDVLGGKNKDEQILRRRHKLIAAKVEKLETEFRKLKRQIFGLVKIKTDHWARVS